MNERGDERCKGGDVDAIGANCKGGQPDLDVFESPPDLPEHWLSTRIVAMRSVSLWIWVIMASGRFELTES